MRLRRVIEIVVVVIAILEAITTAGVEAERACARRENAYPEDLMRFVVSLSSGSFESLLAAASSDSLALGQPDPRI